MPRKQYLQMDHDGKSYVEVQPQEATHIAVPVRDMEKLEAELEDQRRHIASLQQILREKSNRELKIRPAKGKSGYTLWSVTIDPRYRPTAESDPIQAYRVRIKTPWLLEEVDMDTAVRLWKDDADRVCAEWGGRLSYEVQHMGGRKEKRDNIAQIV